MCECRPQAGQRRQVQGRVRVLRRPAEPRQGAAEGRAASAQQRPRELPQPRPVKRAAAAERQQEAGRRNNASGVRAADRIEALGIQPSRRAQVQAVGCPVWWQDLRCFCVSGKKQQFVTSEATRGWKYN